VERGERRERVGQVVEDEDEIRLDEGRGRDADRVALRQRHAGFERRHCVVGKGAHRATREAGHAVGRLDASPRDERPDRLERVGRPRGRHRQVRRVGRDRQWTRLDRRLPVPDLEQPPRADAQERVAPEPLAALDRLEQVRRRDAVVEPEERPDRRLQVGRAGRPQEDRVGVRREAFGLGQAERIGCRHVSVASVRRAPHPGIKTTLTSRGRKVVPSAVPPSFGDAALM
jgi:hypothetical protein